MTRPAGFILNWRRNETVETGMTYDRGAIAFHWFLALMIVGQAILGFNLESFPKETQLYWINIHV